MVQTNSNVLCNLYCILLWCVSWWCCNKKWMIQNIYISVIFIYWIKVDYFKKMYIKEWICYNQGLQAMSHITCSLLTEVGIFDFLQQNRLWISAHDVFVAGAKQEYTQQRKRTACIHCHHNTVYSYSRALSLRPSLHQALMEASWFPLLLFFAPQLYCVAQT